MNYFKRFLNISFLVSAIWEFGFIVWLVGLTVDRGYIPWGWAFTKGALIPIIAMLLIVFVNYIIGSGFRIWHRI